MGRTELPTLDEIRKQIELEEHGKALEMLRLWEVEQPENSDVQTKIAYCLIHLHRFADAEDILHEVLSKKPNHMHAGELLRDLERMPTLQLEKQHREKAREEAQQPLFVKKACPNCEKKVTKEFLYCPYCHYLFKGQLAWRGFVYVGLPILLIIGARFLLHSVLFPEGASPDTTMPPGNEREVSIAPIHIFLFVYHFVISVGALFGAALMVNSCLPDRKWNEEWKMDLAAACFVITGVIFTKIMLLGVSGSFGILGIFYRTVIFCFQIFLLFLFFQRGILATVVMLLLFIFTKAILFAFFQFALGIDPQHGF